MSSREISFWIDERWYDALSKRLPVPEFRKEES